MTRSNIHCATGGLSWKKILGGAYASAGIPVQTQGLLSPYGIIRMAADLDGGVQHTTDLRRCPDCLAAAPSCATVCEWCGTSITDFKQNPI